MREHDAQALGEAVRRLPEPQRELMPAVLERPGSRYRELADALGTPIGSIGPIRQRSLERLRGDAVLVAKLSA